MTNFLLALIIFLAAFLRLFALNLSPPSLNWDEVSHGYNAYSILTTGKDEWGQSFPLTSFRIFGDYKLPFYIYLTAPLTAFGLNEWTVRMVSALSGVGAVLFTFLLVQKLFKNQLLSLLSALFLAFSPWHLLLSRAAFEANLSLFLVILATWLFLLGLEKEKFLPLSALFCGLSLYAYNSAKIFVPLLIILLAFIYRKEIFAKMKFSVLALVLFLLMFLPHLVLLPSQEGQARFYWSTILDSGAIANINQARGTSTLPGPLPRIVNNKATYFLSHFFPNWFSHYSAQFLFFQGGSHYQYSIPGKGVAYPLEIPFVIVGLFAFLFLRTKGAILVLFWLVFGPIAASVTRESPNVLRSILTLPSLQIISAFGVIKVAEWFGKFEKEFKTAFLALFVALLFFSSGVFLKNYFGEYRIKYSWAWQYGYKEMARFVKENYDSYDRFVITKKYGEPHEFLLFYLKWPPQKYQTDPNLVRYFRSNWYWVDRFDKFYFVNDWEIKENLKKRPEQKTLLITSPGNYPDYANKLLTVPFLTGVNAFEIVEL
ncbi:hypothetical protein A2Z23_02965 [Candidatus Curtissbacteria bacterium RBG_16_39_7]|uniref:Glycosyltransferase RgtA/B/C/D-like domain-containing protein n=1 Tax=Candidatus Curtissbacteria bacterium RBG_16_39_7 TaxID=1797707 RepID=A0A1F5G1Y7_9BACT|nr:MAG: hypothetical protein A2Z23_02965 [Candidatus Curtissbacteria bacterium RBG_16_39_7]